MAAEGTLVMPSVAQAAAGTLPGFGLDGYGACGSGQPGVPLATGLVPNAAAATWAAAQPQDQASLGGRGLPFRPRRPQKPRK